MKIDRGFQSGLMSAGVGIWQFDVTALGKLVSRVLCDGVELRHAARAHSDEGTGWWYQGSDFDGHLLVCAPGYREAALN